MFCKNCGAEIDDKAVVCPRCGVPVKGAGTGSDAPSTGFAVLSFFFPLIGLILYIIWHTEYPLKAKSCGKGALIGFCVSVGISILSVVMMSCLTASLLSTL